MTVTWRRRAMLACVSLWLGTGVAGAALAADEPANVPRGRAEDPLAIDPKHRGAHEYIGEAYLMLGNVAKAREHLARLDRLCTFSCSEYRDLKKAIETYEKTGKVSVTTW